MPFYGVYDWTNRDDTGSADLLELLETRIVKDTFDNSPQPSSSRRRR